MLIRIRRGWELSESKATPESVVMARRSLLGAGAGLLAGAGTAEAQWLNPSRLFGVNFTCCTPPFAWYSQAHHRQ